MDFLPYLIDAVVVLVFVCVVLDGRKRGFVKMVLSLVAAVISIVVAGGISEPIAVSINDAYVHDIIIEEINNSYNVEEITAADVEEIEKSLPEPVAQIAEEAGISIEEILTQAVDAKGNVIETIVDASEENLIIPVLSMLVFAAVYIILMIIFAIIIRAVNIVFKLPVINKLNKELGAVLGAIKGVTVISVCSIAAVFGASLAPQTKIAEAVVNSILLNKIFEITSGFIL